MAWQDVIIGYKLKYFETTDIIPVGAIFVKRLSGKTYLCGSYYPYEYYVYQVPIYKKQNVKTK